MSNMNTQTDPKVIVALDYATAEAALDFAKQLDPRLCRVKVGKELFTRVGPSVLEKLHALGLDVFLDLKYHDIPNTVAKACQAAAELGVWMVNVHASGGQKMMEAAKEAVEKASLKGSAVKTKLIAVTVLTSMSADELLTFGITVSPQEQVLRLATLAQQSGMDGVVCSALEAEALRARCGDGFLLVTPGIRLADSEKDDQTRIMTPDKAVRSGASYLVMGRPITQAESPVAQLESINALIDNVDA